MLLPGIWFQSVSEMGCWERHNLMVFYFVVLWRERYFLEIVNTKKIEYSMNKLKKRPDSLLPIWEPGEFSYIKHSQYISAVSMFLWDQSQHSEQLVKVEPKIYRNGANGKRACDERVFAITTHQSHTPASEWEKNIQPWNLLRFCCALGYSNNALTGITLFDAHTFSHTVLTHLCHKDVCCLLCASPCLANALVGSDCSSCACTFLPGRICSEVTF